MTTDELKKRLDKFPFDNISLGYSEIMFVRSDNFDENQIGYRLDTDSTSLIGNNGGDWRAEWYVIASDNLGDPLFVDINSNKIYTAMHGEGSWEPTCVADSFGNFECIIDELHNISIGRENPVALENNPIPIQTKTSFFELVTKNNITAEDWYWKLKIGEEV